MIRLLFALLVCLPSFAADAYRLASPTDLGSCFPVNLEKYGFKGKRYLLTAGHCALANPMKVEVKDKWLDAKLVKINIDLDIAIIQVEEDLPDQLQLSDEEPGVGEELTFTGSPMGAKIETRPGNLKEIAWNNRKFNAGFTHIEHGMSGGPVQYKGKVVGLIDAMPSSVRKVLFWYFYEEDDKTCLYLTLSQIKGWLRSK